MLELTELHLEGFEVFDKPTRIALRRLTFLFGPNWSGKNSIEHAIRLLSEICRVAGNKRPCRTLSGLPDEMTRLVALGFGVQRIWPAIRLDHEALIEHLVNGDARAAEMVARRHVETFREMTLEKVLASLRDSAALVLVGPIRNLDGRA